MDATLILIDSDAELDRARALVDTLMASEDPADTAPPYLGGDKNSSFSGALYFPKVQHTFFGNSKSYNTGIIVADAISLSGNPTINLLGTAGLPPGVTVIKNAILVE